MVSPPFFFNHMDLKPLSFYHHKQVYFLLKAVLNCTKLHTHTKTTAQVTGHYPIPTVRVYNKLDVTAVNALTREE